MEWRAFERIVYMGLSMDAFDISDMTSQLYRLQRGVYINSLGHLAEQAGYEGLIPVLSDRVAINQILGESRWAAGSIARTYNRDLERAIRRIRDEWVEEHGSLKGLNRNILAARLRRWARKRGSWKNRQIGLDHTGRADSRAVRQFLERNGIQGRARAMPPEAVCDFCKAVVARGWMAIEQVLGIVFPAHSWCPHFWELEFDSQFLPSIEELFLGQAEGKQVVREAA